MKEKCIKYVMHVALWVVQGSITVISKINKPGKPSSSFNWSCFYWICNNALGKGTKPIFPVWVLSTFCLDMENSIMVVDKEN